MPQERARKLFSLQEANELVPALTEAFDTIRRERASIEAILPEIRRAVERRREGGGSPYGAQYIESLERINDQVDRVTDLGVLVKDGDQGLCDFPSSNSGRLVLLCWRYGETAVEWWHSLDEGFAGRRPIEDLEPEAP